MKQQLVHVLDLPMHDLVSMLGTMALQYRDSTWYCNGHSGTTLSQAVGAAVLGANAPRTESS